MTGTAKIHIDLSRGLVEAEGTAEFVKGIYEDFRERLFSSKFSFRSDDLAEAEINNSDSVREDTPRPQKRKSTKTRSSASAGSSPASGTYVPKLDKGLDTSKLSAYSSQWAPKNHAERMLIYTKFIEDVLGLGPCNADQIFTCYRQQRERVPEAFLQAIRDASGNRYGFLEYRSPHEIRTTLRGTNHFEHGGLARRTTE